MPSSKLSKEERLQKSLTAAAKILTKLMHVPKAKRNAMTNAGHDSPVGLRELTRVYQVWCPDTEEVIGDPTTDEALAMRIRNEHNLLEGHNARVLVSR